MALTSRTLEITVLSGEDLRIHRKPVEKKSFAIVKIDSQIFGSTQFDDDGGSFPSWNQKMALKLPENVRFLTVEVHCGSSSRNRIIGAAEVPVSDFMGGSLPENYLNFLSYRLRDCNGERNGIVNIAVRVKVPDDSNSRTKFKFQSSAGKSGIGSGVGDEVAIGIPIWSGCPNKF